MTEVEIKAALTAGQFDDILAKASSYGYAFEYELTENDIYMNGADRDFRKTDEALRIRETENVTLGEKFAYITYKGPKIDEVSMTRKELEVQASDAKTAQALLEELGFHAVFHVLKQRRKFVRGDVSLYLDRVEGLGLYLELEQLALDDENYDSALGGIFECLKQLGIPEMSLERRSYLEMLMRKANI